MATYDPACALVDDQEITAFMADAFETDDAGYIAHALGIVARAKGMTQIARDTGLSREQLYRSFSEAGNPTLKTTLVVIKALSIDLTAKPHAEHAAVQHCRGWVRETNCPPAADAIPGFVGAHLWATLLF